MSRSFILCFLFVVGGLAARGQVIDTSKVINTWKLMHNFTRFEEFPIDTNTHQFQRDYNPAFLEGFSYESLGILGQALNHVDFFLRPEPESFVFGRAWDPYLKTPGRTLFFNTKKPFTSLSYFTMPLVETREESISALHTQNVTPFTNFGLDLNLISGKELYQNENTRIARTGFFISHAKDRYSVFGTLYYNDFRVDDHGGLVDIGGFLEGNQDNWWLYPMRLSNAKSHYRNLSLFATQNYHLFERQVHTDTLGVTTTTGKTISLSHQIHFDRFMKDYYDQVDPNALSPIYSNVYYEAGSLKDSVSEGKLTNVFQLIVGDPDYDKISVRTYLGYEIHRYGSLSPSPQSVFSHVDTISTVPLSLDSIFRDSAVARFGDHYDHDIYVGFNLAGPTTGTWDWVIDGSYYLLGYYRHNFQVNVLFSRKLMGKTDLGIRGTMDLKSPHYFTQHYASSFFQWDHEFPSMFRIKGEAFLKNLESGLDVRTGATLITNYIYWDQEALPRVYGNEMLVLSGFFSKHFIVSGYHSDDRVLLQYTTGSDVLRLPLLSFYTSNYWKQSLFKGALIVDLGFDLSITTPYMASYYMPATGQFHLQDEGEVGGYPFLDLFLTFRIKRTRIGVSYNNVLQGLGIVENNFFTTYRYPMKPRHFRFGLTWTFYD